MRPGELLSPLILAYLTHFLDPFDLRLLASLDQRENIRVITVAITPSFPPELPTFSRVKVVKLFHRLFPFDDPWRTEYSYFASARIRLGQYIYACQLMQLFRREHVDVVHAGWVQDDGMVAALSGFHPFLLMPWGSDILLNPDRSRRSLNRTRWVIEKADYISCDCETVREKILAIAPTYPKDRFFVMPWGVDIEHFRPSAFQLTGSVMRLVMTRYFLPVYNITFFIDVVAKIRKEIPLLQVTLIGDGPERQNIEKRIKELGLVNCVRILGRLPHEELTSHLQSSSLYVSSSLSDGTSISLLEAMSCGLPCAVSDIPSNREWITDGKNGILFNPKDVDGTAARLIALLRSPEKLRSYGEECRKAIEARADWKRNVEKLVDVYLSLKAESR